MKCFVSICEERLSASLLPAEREKGERRIKRGGGTMRNKRAKVAAYDTMPRRACSRVELSPRVSEGCLAL